MIFIEEFRAHLGDHAALAKLLASMPLPRSVRPLLLKPFFGRKWNSMEQRDHWLASDGLRVVYIEISGVSASLAARLRMRFDDCRAATPGLIPSRTAILELLSLITEDSRVA